MSSPTKVRTVRPLRGGAYIRLWSYMNKRDRVYAMCWFARVHDEKVAVIKGTPALRQLLERLLNVLGPAGRVLSGILAGLDAISAADILACDNALLRGPSDAPGVLRGRAGDGRV